MSSRWRARPPEVTNRRMHPGLRHPSRLFTPPSPWERPADPYPDAQIKLVQNKFEAHSQILMHLVDGMHLFSFQLPNMGTAYIARLVFDVGAFSVLLLHNGRVAGGICSKFFIEQGFIEIVFCAVESRYQARGYGRVLMNHVKDYLQTLEIYDILTCADNEAVTYFRKQGFNKHEIMMDPKRWVGCIKDYDGITLVHCHIRGDVDYRTLPDVYKKQWEILTERTGVAIQPPLQKLIPQFVPFPQSPTVVNVPIPEILKNYAPIGTTRQKKSQKQLTEEYNARMSELREKLLFIFNELRKNQKFLQVFGTPVTEDLAPGYFETVKRPMDLSTIEKRLYRYPDYYKRPEVFAADIKLMCDDCKLFNTPDTGYYKSAVDLMRKFTEMYDDEFPEFPFS